MELLAAIIIVVATYSVTRLLVADTFPPIDAARTWVVDTRGPALGYLVTCPWCTGVYVAAGMVAAVDWWTDYRVPLPALAIMGLRATTGIIATLVGD